MAWFATALSGLARAARLAAADERRRHRRPLVKLTAGLGLSTAGGELLGEGLRNVVSRLGVSQTLLGNTVIAASVEAEEIARVAVPAKRQRGDLALANIAGTIVHFVAFNAAVIALVKPLELDAATVALHLPVAAGSALVLCALVGLRGGISRRAAAALVALYLAYIAAAIIVAL